MIQFKPLGILRTCYKEKFGIPRQANLVAAPGTLEFYPEFSRKEAVRGLAGFSHIWLIFLFHKIPGSGNHETGGRQRSWSPMVRPPRLGGNKKVGIFASRSPFRPNPVGMSAVKLDAVDMTEKGLILQLSGVDILDKTPILDVKPYLPYADAIPEAVDGFAHGPPKAGITVVFSDKAMAQIRERESKAPRLLAIITGILENDPRPAYFQTSGPHQKQNRIFGIRIFDFDLRWTMSDRQIRVIELVPFQSGPFP